MRAIAPQVRGRLNCTLRRENGAQEDFVKNWPSEVNAARAEAFQTLYDVANFGPASDRVRAA